MTDETTSLSEHLKQPIAPEQLDQFTDAWEEHSDPDREYVPAEGWLPEHFPQMTVAPIPYTSFPHSKPDPFITITNDGWMFIEAGNIRIALPDREEWDKLVNMVERMWNTHQDREVREFTPPPAPEDDFPPITAEEFFNSPPPGVADEGDDPGGVG